MNENNNTAQTLERKGGRVLASGGFGCIFSPALKCKGSTTREKGKISKLMTQRHAKEELEEINKISKKTRSIKNNGDYFLLRDATLCEPEKISNIDLEDYSKKCSALNKIDITKSNVNDNLDKLMLLNMPDGGLAVDDYIYTQRSYNTIYDVHTKLIELFKNGVIPMNSKNVFHCDIKDSNVLVDDSSSTKLKTRLIDWGLATIYRPFVDAPFPRTWRNRPLQFNVPFSVIIFSDSFVEKYSDFVEKGGNYNDDDELRPFVIDYITSWMRERGAGHYKFINEIMYMLYSKSLTNINEKTKPMIIETEFTMHYISNYIISILKKYTRFRKDGKLNLREYLDNVFIKNVDVWGFVNIYFPIIELLYNNYERLNQEEMELFEKLKIIFIDYLYLNASRPINKELLINRLDEIGDILRKILYGKTTCSRKLIKTSSKSHSTTSSKKMSIQKKCTKTKKRKSTSNVSFKRKSIVKRFKNPVFLT